MWQHAHKSQRARINGRQTNGVAQKLRMLAPTIYQVDWEHKMVTLGSKMLICAPTTVTMESFFCVILSLTTARLPTPSTSTHRITCI